MWPTPPSMNRSTTPLPCISERTHTVGLSDLVQCMYNHLTSPPLPSPPLPSPPLPFPPQSYLNPATPGSGTYENPSTPSPYRVPESLGSSYSNPYTPGSGYYQGGDYGSVSSPSSNLSVPHTLGGRSPYMPSPLTPTSYDGQWRELGEGREFVVITLNCAICISEVWLRLKGERS